jgi:twitching motility protein PilU
MIDVTKFLSVMVEHGASDLYITLDSPPMYRINGVTRPAGNRSLTDDDLKELALSVMSDKQRSEFEAENELNLALYYKSLGRFRLNHR